MPRAYRTTLTPEQMSAKNRAAARSAHSTDGVIARLERVAAGLTSEQCERLRLVLGAAGGDLGPLEAEIKGREEEKQEQRKLELKRARDERRRIQDEARNGTVSGADIAREQGVSRQAVNLWTAARQRNGFPAPVINHGTNVRYDAAAVARWLASRAD